MLAAGLRRCALSLALPALVLGASATPAFAGSYDDDDDYDFNVVHVTVCKKVKDAKDDKYDDDDDDYYKNKDRYGYDDTKFVIIVKTDEDKEKVKLKDGECKVVHLDFDDPFIKVREKEEDGYTLKKIKFKGRDVKRTWEDKAKFKDKDNAKVKVIVINKKDKDYDDEEDDEYDD